MRVKRDILAAITFLITGLVFFVAQMEGRSNKLYSEEGDCCGSETVLVKDANTVSPTLESLSRDS